MKKILLIGAGQLGSRHLQALKKISVESEIFVVDPSDKSLEVAKSRYDEVPGNPLVGKLNTATSVSALGSHDFDFCVIATTANVRLATIKELLAKNTVKYLVLEKVVFQSVDEFSEAERIFSERSVSVWVNCPRRMFPVWAELRSMLKEDSYVSIQVSGGAWGLGCNALHYLDALNFLKPCIGGIKYDIAGLDPVIHDSRRPGFVEFGGTIVLSSANGNELILRDDKKSLAPITVTIMSESLKAVLFESLGIGYVMRKSEGWKIENIAFESLYQSNLTQLVAERVFSTGSCELTPFSESKELHVPILAAFNEHIKHITSKNVVLCPIT